MHIYLLVYMWTVHSSIILYIISTAQLKDMKNLMIYLFCFFLPTLSFEQLPPNSEWSNCGVDSCSDDYPYVLEDGKCLQPDGITCTGVTTLCSDQPNTKYNLYWVASTPSSIPTCNDCDPGDLCYNQTRFLCSGPGEGSLNGSEILCARARAPGNSTECKNMVKTASRTPYIILGPILGVSLCLNAAFVIWAVTIFCCKRCRCCKYKGDERMALLEVNPKKK